jgi:hypothetical protein
MVRTVEQLLGITPMNQEDHSAEPMYQVPGRKIPAALLGT